jgi:hypothetical protein
VVSLERRVELLEERRLRETIDLIFERARAASLDDVAQFLMAGYELEQKPEPDEEEERCLWEFLGIPLETVRLAEGRPELWHTQLGDLLGGRRGLQEHVREHHPELKEKLLNYRKEKEG